MTKSKLLASTMLVSAAAMMAAGSANAVKLKIGGFGEYWIGYADNARGTGADVRNDFDVKQDAELYFSGEDTLDNGMKVGARFELEAGNGNDNDAAGLAGFDESFAWVKASWGQVNIGNNDVATGYVGGVSTVGPVGIIKSDANDWISGGNAELNNTDADVGLGDSQNITYFTPRVAGFQVIVSYTPDSSDVAASDFDDQETAGLHNGISVAAKYAGKIGGSGFGLNAGYTTVELAEGAAAGANGSAFNVAGWVEVGAFKLTGAYAKEQVTDTDEFWGTSVVYKMNKANTVSLAYGKGTESQNGNAATIGQDNKSSLVTLGYTRSLGKGVTLGASLFKTSNSGPALTAATDNDGVGLVGGLVIKF